MLTILAETIKQDVGDTRQVMAAFEKVQTVRQRIADVRCRNHPDRRWEYVRGGEVLCSECYSTPPAKVQ